MNTMDTPLNASARSAGALLSGSSFEIPPFQREYSWGLDEVADFWTDLCNGIKDRSYFLGLIILTESDDRKQVVDGQQRLLTLSLLAAALYHEAVSRGRKALAERIQAEFLKSIDYETDETHPRVVITDAADNATFQSILEHGAAPDLQHDGPDSISQHLRSAFNFLRDKLREDLAADPFKRLGAWTEFITNHLYFAVFVHPDASSAYRVYEVVNTRGKELTTADLLKNYVLSQTKKEARAERHKQWQAIARQFLSNGGASSFVQYIHHVVTVHSGYILPKDLFEFLALRRNHGERIPPTVDQLMELLREHLPLYMQMVDPTLAGPADPEALPVFSAFDELGVTAVRPLLLAIAALPDALDGMRYILRLVVRRIVVSNLGTGGIERKFGDAAKHARDLNNWRVIEEELRDLNPQRQEFLSQIARRSFNKNTLAFLRKSVIAKSATPNESGILHFIMPKNIAPWESFSDEDAAFWSGTIGNTYLSALERRPIGASEWAGFKALVLPTGIKGEWEHELECLDDWNVENLEQLGEQFSEVAAQVWY